MGIRQGDSLIPILFHIIMDESVTEVTVEDIRYLMCNKEVNIVCY